MKFIKGNIYRSKKYGVLLECVKSGYNFCEGKCIKGEIGGYRESGIYTVNEKYLVLEQEMQDYEIF